MVKVVVAGGSGGIDLPGVASEIIEQILAKKKHEVIALSRKDVQPTTSDNSLRWVKVDYLDLQALTAALDGAEVVLSFITVSTDPGNIAQKNLIDASIKAGVKRFAPAEWAASGSTGMPQYEPKKEIVRYLEELNAEEKVLEYCLFQPGMIMNYWGYPYSNVKHLSLSRREIDLENRRAIVVGNGNQLLCTTLIQDVGRVVAEALDYEGEWPKVGGIVGTKATYREILEMAERVRGGPFAVESVEAEELESGQLTTTSWVPLLEHPAVPVEKRPEMSKIVSARILKSFLAGIWVVSDEWNKLLPDLKLTGAEDFMREIWEGKP